MLSLKNAGTQARCHLHSSNHVLFDNTGLIESKSVTKIVGKSNFIEEITSYFRDKLYMFKVFEKYQEFFTYSPVGK